jgi:hypothetical protein
MPILSLQRTNSTLRVLSRTLLEDQAAGNHEHNQRRRGGVGCGERLARLETTVAELRQEMAIMRQKIDDLFGDG